MATTGRVPDRRRRTAFELEPALRYALSDRTSIGVRYNHLNVSYEDGVSVGLFDYTNDVGELTANYQLSETEELWTSFFGGRFETQQIDRTTDSLALTVGYSKAFSETLDASLSVGGVTSTSKGSPFGLSLTSDSTGWVFDLEVSKRFEKTRVDFRSSQTRTPTGQGRLVERTDAFVGITYDFDPFWSADFGALAFRNRSLGEATTRSDVNVVTVDIGVIRRLTRHWSISGSYRYRRREEERTSLTAESNAIFLTITYTGDRFSMSR